MGYDWQRQPRDAQTGHWARKQREEPRSNMMQIRCTADEWTTIATIAEETGETYTDIILRGLRAATDTEGKAVKDAAGARPDP